MNKAGLFGGGWQDHFDALNDAFDRYVAENMPPHPFGASADAIMTGYANALPGADTLPGGQAGGAGAAANPAPAAPEPVNPVPPQTATSVLGRAINGGSDVGNALRQVPLIGAVQTGGALNGGIMDLSLTRPMTRRACMMPISTTESGTAISGLPPRAGLSRMGRSVSLISYWARFRSGFGTRPIRRRIRPEK